MTDPPPRNPLSDVSKKKKKLNSFYKTAICKKNSNSFAQAESVCIPFLTHFRTPICPLFLELEKWTTTPLNFHRKQAPSPMDPPYFGSKFIKSLIPSPQF